MRIAMFTDTYLPSRDGVVTSVLSTKEQLEKLGHEVLILAPAPKDAADRQPGVVYFKAKSFSKYQGYTIPMFPTDKCRILQERGVDVIHAQGLLFQALRGIFAAKKLRIPIVVSFHTMVTDAVDYYNFTPIPGYMAAKLMWIYLRQLMRRADAVIAPTETIARELKGLAPGMRRVAVIPTGVDCQRFHPNIDVVDYRHRHGWTGKRIILTVGRVAREKNLELVLEGFRNLAVDDDMRLVIAGQGPAKEYYINMVEKMGLADKVEFPGFIPDEELPMLYSACDVFTIASKFETQGLVVLEAMACGKVCTGIDFRALGEIIRDGENGYLFEDSADSWTDVMRKALGDPKDIGRNARSTAEGFSQRSSALKLVEEYELAIATKRERLAKRRFGR